MPRRTRAPTQAEVARFAWMLSHVKRKGRLDYARRFVMMIAEHQRILFIDQALGLPGRSIIVIGIEKNEDSDGE